MELEHKDEETKGNKVSRKNRRKHVRRNVLERSLCYVKVNGYCSKRENLQNIIE